MFTQVLITEFGKLRRSSVPWVTLAVVLFAPWAIALFMWIVRDPARAASLGLLGTKANLAGLEATWPAYSGYLAMIVGASGMLLLAFIVAYLFGREYLDQTAKNLLALPIRREWFAVGKLTVAAVWWLILALAGLGEGLLIGRLLDLPGFSTQVLAGTVGNALLLAAISFALCPVVAWLTVATRNVLAAVGFALGMLLIGDLLSRTGWAVWFPWSIIPSVSGMSGSSGTALAPVSLVALLVVFALGVVGTAGQLRWADNP